MGLPKLKFWFKQFGVSSSQIVVMNFLFVLLFVGFLFSYLQKRENSVTLLSNDEEFNREFQTKVVEIESLWYEQRSQPNPVALNISARININQAFENELTILPGIGPTLAKRIIDFREKHKGFKKLEDLKKVKGIGEKKFEKIYPFIKLN